MLAARAVTRFAADAEHHISASVTIDDRGVGHGFEPRCMALKAPRRNGTRKVRPSVRVPWTVRPPNPLPIRDGELVQPITGAPIEVRLAFPRAGHEGDPLRVAGRVGYAPHHRGLIETRGGGVHAEVQERIRRSQDILTTVEAARDGFARRRPRSQTVSGLFEARLLLVTGEAGGVTRGIVCTHRLGLRRGRE